MDWVDGDLFTNKDVCKIFQLKTKNDSWEEEKRTHTLCGISISVMAWHVNGKKQGEGDGKRDGKQAFDHQSK